MPTPIEIVVGALRLDAELADTATARALAAALPIETAFNTWGDEIYFSVPVVEAPDETATEEVEVGTLAYWPAGAAVAIFFGRTPASTDARPRPVEPVNLVGRVLGDATRLREAKAAPTVRIARK